MYKKHLILGIGIGIFIASLVFFCAFYIYNSRIVISDEVDVNEDYIIEKATDMGMIFFDRLQFQDGQTTEDGTMVVSPDEFVYVSIPKNAMAVEVADILVEAGLVTDKTQFINYLIDANLTRSLKFGDFLIPKDATPEEIATMLTS